MPSTFSVLAKSDSMIASDLDQLQGSWSNVAGPRSATMRIEGTRFTFEFLDGDLYKGTFFLDPEAEPKQMDMLIEVGPTEDQGHIALCIYQIADGVLRWCPTKPGTDRRLTNFPRLDDGRYNSMLFKQSIPRRSR